MRLPGTLRWVTLAIVGLLIAAAVAVAASRLASRQIGLASEPISAGRELAPRPPDSKRHNGGGQTITKTTTTTTTNPTAPSTPGPTSPPTTSNGDSGGSEPDGDD
jgi:hypothetical protein